TGTAPNGLFPFDVMDIWAPRVSMAHRLVYNLTIIELYTTMWNQTSMRFCRISAQHEPTFPKLVANPLRCSSRRTFLRDSLILGGAIHTLPGRLRAAETAAKPLFSGFAIPPRPGVQEATLAKLDDGRYWLLFGE